MEGIANLTAVILAGGRGTRLRSVVADRPKVLAEVRRRPFLAYLLDQLADAGIRSIILCTGYKGEQVRDMFGGRYGNVCLLYSEETRPLGTAGALRLAFPMLNSDPVLILNGDSFCDVDLEAFWAWHWAHDANGTLLLTDASDTQRYGRVRVDAEGFVLRFNEKGQGSGSGWINAGIYLLRRHLLLEIPANCAVSLERDMFPAWIGRGLWGFRARARFLDIGVPEAYAQAEQFFFAPGSV